MATIRAKFQCQSSTTHHWNADSRTYRFQAIYDQGLAEEDRSFGEALAAGTLEIQVDNPNAKFEVGAYYYLDFAPAPDAKA